jgi:hypothetical protein
MKIQIWFKLVTGRYMFAYFTQVILLEYFTIIREMAGTNVSDSGC